MILSRPVGFLFSVLIVSTSFILPISAEVFQENVITNGKFADDLAGWSTNTVTAADLGSQYALDGQYLTMGKLNGYQAIGQSFVVPADTGRATLTFYYRLYTSDTTSNDYLAATLSVAETDHVLASDIIPASDGDVYEWTKYTLDVSDIAGETVYLSLVVRNDAELFTFVDLDTIRLKVDSYGELKGTVKDEDGNLLRNADVTIRKPNNTKIWTGHTNKKGKFTATDLPGNDKKYRVIIKKNEVTLDGNAKIEWGEQTKKTFTLDV